MVEVTPNLAFCHYPTCPVDRRCLTSSEWFAVECLRVCCFSLTLGTITHDVETLVVQSLGPDFSILLDNSVLSIFGAVLDWENQVMSFPSTGDFIPAVHRTSFPASRPADPSTVASDSNLSVAAVHHDAEGVDVRLRERVHLKPRHEALVVAFTDCLPAHDSTVVVEPLIMSELEFLESSSSSVFEKIIAARTLATWHAADGSVAVKIANPSCDGVALPVDLCLGQG